MAIRREADSGREPERGRQSQTYRWITHFREDHRMRHGPGPAQRAVEKMRRALRWLKRSRPITVVAPGKTEPNAAPAQASQPTEVQIRFPLFGKGSQGAPSSKGVYQRALQPPGVRRVRFREEAAPRQLVGRALRRQLDRAKQPVLSHAQQRLRDGHLSAAWKAAQTVTRRRKEVEVHGHRVRSALAQIRERVDQLRKITRAHQEAEAARPAPWPGDSEPEDQVTRQARWQAKIAEAGTYHLPEDNSDEELNPPEKEPGLHKLASIRPEIGVDAGSGQVFTMFQVHDLVSSISDLSPAVTSPLSIMGCAC
ncbi:hypothetical protein CYMTET_31744 [Cymbomonas tetramitiformis]|uniref:Uncharacterized protein n=1 Tax=Cymbomonas tetramitiformis TaxID=36881 RepID=A0AAE0KSK4_9CHLO|nr:hypothetical protein CYMTET_31744 [Cymbomonas tetramitiformis]